MRYVVCVVDELSSARHSGFISPHHAIDVAMESGETRGTGRAWRTNGRVLADPKPIITSQEANICPGAQEAWHHGMACAAAGQAQSCHARLMPTACALNDHSAVSLPRRRMFNSTEDPSRFMDFLIVLI